MRIDRSDMENNTYTMNGQPLRQSAVEKDIGVFVDEKLSFDTHTTRKVNIFEANQVMGIIRTYDYLDESSFFML